MKRLVAIMFSIILVISQALAGVATYDASQAASCGCDCGRPACCSQPASPNPEPAPAVPANSAVNGATVFWAIPVCSSFEIELRTTSPTPPPEFIFAEISTVPLYVRNHTLLI